MNLELWMPFAALIALATLSPGPNVLIVVTNSLRYGLTGGLLTILGNLIALFSIALLAAVGVGAVLKTSPIVFMVMKLVGAAYLIWMGYKMLKSSLSRYADIEITDEQKQIDLPARNIMLQAISISLSNPKAILFLSAAFPSFLNLEAAIAPQFMIMFSTIIVIVGSIHTFYALLAMGMRKRLASGRARKWMARISGITFVGLGAGLAGQAVRSS